GENGGPSVNSSVQQQAEPCPLPRRGRGPGEGDRDQPARTRLIPFAAAQPAVSCRVSAQAIRSGNWSGVQANTGQPSAARAWAWSNAGRPSSDNASSTIRLTPLRTSSAARASISAASPPS